MIPLLHALSLLQGAVRSNRVSHFQPSTACMISCVRSILSATECLPREAPLLQRFALLAQERKRILSVLASLVAQAKKASEDPKGIEPDRRDAEVDAMLRLGGQVFAHVRRFLAVAVQCGVELPQRRRDSNSGLSSTDSGDLHSTSPTAASPVGHDHDRTSPVMVHTARTAKPSPFRDIGATNRPMAAFRAKSMFDLRQRRKLDMVDEPQPTTPHRTLPATAKQRTVSHKPALPSFSSTSSSSSMSSTDSASPPATPPFPSGSATTAQVMEALRHTHDQYLSTIAAFIGHAHSHSRTSHASSTGHMYDLVREVVDVVCKLLTIVEAVMRHPGVPAQKVGNLRSAKEGLYNVTSSLAESVRLLTVSLPSTTTEEEEKAGLLRSATGALKAGADCVAAVKMCLNRSTGERSFIIQLPAAEHGASEPFASDNLSIAPLWKASHPTDTSLPRGLDAREDDDLSAHAQPPSPVHTLRAQNPYASASREHLVPGRSEEVSPTLTEPPQQPLVLKIGVDGDETDINTELLSPTDDGMSWEGSVGGHQQIPGTPIEEQILNSNLPTVPLEPVPVPGSDPVTWMLSHNYSISDVAYNSEGNLVGATMEALVERMTPHDSIVDPAFASVFFLTFRLFSSPSELLETIQTRFNLSPPQNLSPEDRKIWEQRKGVPVRLRVSNFIKSWLEMYWRSAVDNVVLDPLMNFTRDCIALTCAAPAQRITELIHTRLNSAEATISPRGERLRDPMNPPTLPLSETPRPTMTRTLLSALRNKSFSTISITDFDALELARQLTIMECNLYCAIQPEEIVESGQEGVRPPVNVRALSTLSTTLTGWIAESILNEPDLKKRQGLIKFFIKLADVSSTVDRTLDSRLTCLQRCTGLNNYSTPRSILAALDSSTISRLRQTWGVSVSSPLTQTQAFDEVVCRASHKRTSYSWRPCAGLLTIAVTIMNIDHDYETQHHRLFLSSVSGYTKFVHVPRNLMMSFRSLSDRRHLLP
jgi:son of sevenless-like protein